jgi:hypothetical protein
MGSFDPKFEYFLTNCIKDNTNCSTSINGEKYTSQSKYKADFTKCQVITTEDSSSTNSKKKKKKGKDNKMVISTFAGNDLEDSKNSYDRSAPVTDTAIDTATATTTV